MYHTIDASRYDCIVNISLSSSTNWLTIIGNGIEITPFAFPSPLREGNPVAVTCSVLPSTPVSFKWIMNNAELNEEKPRIGFMNMGPMSTLMISHVTEKDEGNYTCIAEDALKSRALFAAELLISSAPKFIIESSNIDVDGLTRQVILDCVARGNPSPKINWLVNGVPGNYQ